ncbi:MAG TPA: tetratricopeptide repeat protein, partial [Candidatus Hydrogenedentes bacterium]|nr:tetratricopeptide repeat protein [Candidatus Hydrogenedentota bacterium]
IRFQAYQHALRLKPDMAKAYTNLGVTFRRLGQADAAIGVYEEALKLDPDDIVTLDNLLSAAQWSGDQERIAFALRRLAELEPEKIDRQLPWGEYLYRSGQYLEAARVYERIVQSEPNISENYYLLGLCYFDGQQWNAAEAAWKRGLEHASEHPSIHKALAVLYWTRGDYMQAWQAVKQCQALNIPLDPEFLDSLQQDSGKNAPNP